MLSMASRGDDGLIQERVHVAPVLFEVDRLILPMKMLKGERVHLMLFKTKNERVRSCLEMVKAELGAIGKPYSVHEDEFDLFGLISSYRRVIDGELQSGSRVYVNLSSGGAIQAIAANYAAMEFEEGVQAFFAYPERYETEFGMKKPQNSSGVSKIAMLPHFNLKMPNESRLQFLDILGKLGEPTKGEILEECRKEGLIMCAGKSRPYGHVVLEDRFIKPLTELGLIMVRRNGGKESRASLTEKGKNTLLINGKGRRHGR